MLELNPGNTQVMALIDRLTNGARIVESPVDESPTTPPVEESSEVSPSDDPAASEESPESPLLTPVNTGSDQTE